MKVLVVNDYATPTGGAEIQLLLLRDELRKRGYDVRFFASCARPGKAESQADYECGAQKCGTTSLHYYLNLHPQISMSCEKELNFFIAGEIASFETFSDGKRYPNKNQLKAHEKFIAILFDCHPHLQPAGSTERVPAGDCALKPRSRPL